MRSTRSWRKTIEYRLDVWRKASSTYDQTILGTPVVGVNELDVGTYDLIADGTFSTTVYKGDRVHIVPVTDGCSEAERPLGLSFGIGVKDE